MVGRFREGLFRSREWVFLFRERVFFWTRECGSSLPMRVVGDHLNAKFHISPIDTPSSSLSSCARAYVLET